MLSWITRKLLPFKKMKNGKSAATTLSKWHLACRWLACAVDGVDMILEPAGSIFVVSKVGSSYDGHVVVSKAVLGSGVRCHLAINMIANRGVEAFEYKAIDEWSEELAKLVASLIALKKPEQNLDPPESMWGIWAYGREMLFPHFKSEEEMFMTMALDGVAIDEKDV